MSTVSDLFANFSATLSFRGRIKLVPDDQNFASSVGAMRLASIFAVALFAGPALGQDKSDTKDPALKVRPVSLSTRDGANLNAYYFPSDQGEQAIPVIVVHEWKGQAGPYARLCLALQDAGFAVLALEYRGHGKSRTYRNPRTGSEDTFDLSKMGRRDFEAIIAFDMEEVKQFLKDENNERRLNLNALSIVGVEEGCLIAAHWAVKDWRFPSIGSKKQGQDVKALAFISPVKNHLGLVMDTALRDPNLQLLPTLIMAGNSSPQSTEAKRIGNRLEGIRQRRLRGNADGFQVSLPDTNLSGAALLTEVPNAIPTIVNFLEANVPVTNDRNPWIERK